MSMREFNPEEPDYLDDPEEGDLDGRNLDDKDPWDDDPEGDPWDDEEDDEGDNDD